MTKKAGANFPCTQCDKTFQTPAARGSHMRVVHGIAGTSYGSKADAMRRAAARTAKEIVPVAPQETLGVFEERPCPECGLTLKGKAALSNHRRAQHGILSPRAGEHKKSSASTDITVPEPTPTKEKAIEQRRTEPEVINSQIDPLLFAYSVGEIKERCRSIAEEHGVPTKLFTRQFAELFLREARR